MQRKKTNSNPKTIAQQYLQPFIDGAYDLSNDKEWGEKSIMELIKEPREAVVAFWRELDHFFKRKERTAGTLFHKGHIYWRLGIEYLLWGKLNTAIFYFTKSAREDRRRGDIFSSAIGLENLLRPLKKKVNAQWLYSQMTKEEREMFAVALLQTHDQSIGKGITLIRDEFFHFIENKAIRTIVHQQYREIYSVILTMRDAPSYYICVFAIGSIVEGIIDDLLVKQKRLVWKTFLGLPDIGHDVDAIKIMGKFGARFTGSRGHRTISPPELTRLKTHKWERVELGSKLEIMRILAKHKKPAVDHLALMEMYVIHEFRNLIHPSHLKSMLLQAPWYVAAVLFTFVSHIAGNSWPKNIKKRLKYHR